MDDPFTPGWAVMDVEGPDLRELFPPLTLDSDLDPNDVPSAGAAGVHTNGAAGKPAHADPITERPADPAPPPVNPRPAIVSLADLAPANNIVRDDDEDEELDRVARGLPLPNLRRRHDSVATAEPNEMMSWLDEVFAPGRADES
jgi:hypothetical protein